MEVFAKSYVRHAFDRKGNTLLHLATTNGNVEIVKSLLEQHASVEAANHDGQTALHLSALRSATALTGTLLSQIKAMPDRAQSAVLNAQDHKTTRTALHYAAKLGSHETVQQLIEAGCDVNALDRSRYTPLMIAAAQGHTAAVAALISGQAKVSMRDSWGNHFLHLAAFDGNADVITALLQGQDIKQAAQACNHRGSVLHRAISSGMHTSLHYISMSHPEHVFACQTHLSAARLVHCVLPLHCTKLYTTCRHRSGKTAYHLHS